MQQDPDHRCCKRGQDDCESTKCPSPVLLVELLGNIRPGISDDDVRRGSEGIRQTTVAQSGRIQSDDVDSEGHASVTYAVEDLDHNAVSMAEFLKLVWVMLTVAAQ